MFNDSLLTNDYDKHAESSLKDFAEGATPPAKEEEAVRHAVKTINESAGGYCIRWQGDELPRVKIGELIGVESPTDRRRYGLGVIRWMTQQPDRALDLGLEVVSTRCEAAEVRAAGKQSPRNPIPAYKCLVINDTDPSSNATASLIMNALNLTTGSDLLLSIGGVERPIRLTKVIEFSSAFARYHFEFVKSEEETPADGSRPEDEFSDLWNSL